MDPATAIVVAGSFAASFIAQQCAEKAMDDAWNKLKSLLKAKLGRDPSPEDLSVASLPRIDPENEPELLAQARAVFAGSSALRRARSAASALDGARVLWVDDNPANNAYERALFEALNMTVDCLTTTQAALDASSHNQYDVIISDMRREARSDEGLRFLEGLRNRELRQPVLFYTLNVDAKRGTPPGAVAITWRPDELVHFVLDVLERSRL